VTAQLLPGSGPLNSSVTRFATTRFGGMADQRSGFTTLVDGGDVDDAQWGSPVINLTQEAVQEFKVFGTSSTRSTAVRLEPSSQSSPGRVGISPPAVSSTSGVTRR